MVASVYRFDAFELDPADRQLRRDGAAVDVNARYLDALVLLVEGGGRLVSKDRFMDEVWRGVPVTDEALTQCIRTLRRLLGDDAARPRFIETVPKHGYRFIAAVEAGRVQDGLGNVPPVYSDAPVAKPWHRVVLLAAAGTVGGGVAGLAGGLLYGFGAASQPLAPGMGAASVLLVILCVTILVAVLGAAGVATGIAAAGAPSRLSVAGGAAGGLVVGAVTKLLGLDALTLLFGRSPGDITGAMEGIILGAAAGIACWATARLTIARVAIAAGAIGAVAGTLIALLSGRMLGGSLVLLADVFPASRLRLDRIGALFGEAGFGPLARGATGAVEGALFVTGVVTAMALARANLSRGRPWPPHRAGR
jgi:DNA-binding winged helix-turn-helix (wHTH) protein